jgi:phage/plasmid-associated DNA primase
MDAKHTLYALQNYSISRGDIEALAKNYDILECQKLLDTDKGYHMRIEPNKPCILYFDLDGYDGEIEQFIEHIKEIYYNQFNINLNIDFDENVSYSQGSDNPESYHISITNYYCNNTSYIGKYFIKPLIAKYPDIYDNTNTKSKVLDDSIYSAKWWKMPNQSINKADKNDRNKLVKRKPQIIYNGQNKDFIITHIPEDCILLDKEITPIATPPQTPPSTPKIDNRANTLIVIENADERDYIFDLIDCLDVKRVSEYNCWMKLGFIFKNEFGDDGYKYFQYVSKLNNDKYDGDDKNKKFYDNLALSKRSSIASLIYMAKTDNCEKTNIILLRQKMATYHTITDSTDINETIICQMIRDCCDKFIYQKGALYCFNGRYWVKYDDKQNALELFRFLNSGEFYDFIAKSYDWMLKSGNYDGSNKLGLYSNLLNGFSKFLGKIVNKKRIQDTLPQYIEDNTIIFDNIPNYLPFENKIFNLVNKQWIEHRADYYITITTGYDWEEPKEDEITKMTEILQSIMPVKTDEDIQTHNSWLHFLSRCLDGHCIEKFIIQCGSGGNGKGLVNDMLDIGLGNFAYCYNSAMLSEKRKTGGNPELANMINKRFCYGREPAANKAIENSIVKEISGGGKFCVRALFSNATQGKINGKMILECNDVPKLAEGSGSTDIGRRLVVYKYKSVFSTDEYQIKYNPYCYSPNAEYKSLDFQEKHKFALLQILFNNYNQTDIIKTKQMKENIKDYLDSNNIVANWFDDNYKYYDSNSNVMCFDDYVDNLSDEYRQQLHDEKITYGIMRVKDLFDDFINSDNYMEIEDKSFNVKNFVDCIKKTYSLHFVLNNRHSFSIKNETIKKQGKFSNILWGFVKKQ